MKGPLDVVSDAGSYEDDETTQQQEEENDDYFQDPASIGKCLDIYCTAIQHLFPFPVPVIDPIPTERFPEYVRDMLYGEENKLKAEFLVRSPYMVLLPFVKECLCVLIYHMNACLNKQDKCTYCVFFPHIVGVCDDSHISVHLHRPWENYLSHPLLWQSYLTTKHTTDSTTYILVSCCTC